MKRTCRIHSSICLIHTARQVSVRAIPRRTKSTKAKAAQTTNKNSSRSTNRPSCSKTYDSTNGGTTYGRADNKRFLTLGESLLLFWSERTNPLSCLSLKALLSGLFGSHLSARVRRFKNIRYTKKIRLTLILKRQGFMSFIRVSIRSAYCSSK